MLCAQDGTIYLISRFLHVIKLPLKCPGLYKSIFDVEWFPNQRMILVFDLLILNNQNVRPRNTSGRFELLQKINWNEVNNTAEHIHIEDQNSLKKVRLVLKKMYYSQPNSFPKKEITKILNNTDGDYVTDGLIFTPEDEPYPYNRKWENLLKWKPPNLNSIDLYIEKGLHMRTNVKGYYLYVNSSQVIYRKTGRRGILIRENFDTVQAHFNVDKIEHLDLPTR